MDHSALHDFIFEKAVDQATIDAYQGKVPNELIEIWQNYGYGIFGNGYFRIINPDDYRDILKAVYTFNKEAIPLLTTAMGDILVWKNTKYDEDFGQDPEETKLFPQGKETLGVVICRKFVGKNLSSPLSVFFECELDEEFLEIVFLSDNYRQLVEKLGIPKYGECFCYPALPLVGEKDDSVYLGDMNIYLDITHQLRVQMPDLKAGLLEIIKTLSEEERNTMTLGDILKLVVRK